MKRILCLLCALTIFCLFSLTAYATNNENSEIKESYQLVIDKLNKEYGINMRFPTKQEAELLGVESYGKSESIEDFELSLRADIEADIKANKEADAMMEKLSLYKIEETGGGICVPSELNNEMKASTVTRSKKVAGATVYLKAVVNKDKGYWRYSSIKNVWTTYVAGVNSKPIYVSRTYNYSIIDGRRTCAVTLRGYTISDKGVIINNNAKRYVEFWAGSGM